MRTLLVPCCLMLALASQASTGPDASARASAAEPAAAAPASAAAAKAPPAGPAVLAPHESLVVDGVPPIPAALPEEVRRYTEARSASLADWHPARREILISTRFANTAQIHRVGMPGGARTQLTFFGEPVNAATYEPREGLSFVFEKDRGGDEFDQLYRCDLADGRVSLLTDGGRSQNGPWIWSTAGDRIAYASTRRNGSDRDLWVMSPADPKTDRLLLEVSGGGWYPLDWSPDDARILLVEFISVNRTNLWLVDAATGEKTALTPGGEEVAYFNARFGADGKGVYLTTDAGSEFQRLAYLDLATKRLTVLTPDLEWDVDGLDLSLDGRSLGFTTNEAGVSRLYLMDTGARRHRPVKGIPLGVISGLRWHRSGRDLGFALSWARSASDVYSVDARSGEVTRWTESELGGLAASDLVEPELVRWPSFDGLEISGFYYRPPVRFAGRRPVIIDIHGGPESQARPGFLKESNYFLNEMGAAILLPNVRGSRGYGKTFVKLDNAQKREDAVRDVGALLDWIAARPDLDAGRVMVTGASYGGFMTLASAVSFSDRIRCAVDEVGISHFATFLKNTESYRRDLRRAEYGDEREPEMAAFFERVSPLANAGRISKPLFVIQGGNDPRVPRSEAEQIVARVRRGKGPVWYLMAKDEGHGFRKKNNVDYAFYATVLFTRRHLLGEPE